MGKRILLAIIICSLGILLTSDATVFAQAYDREEAEWTDEWVEDFVKEDSFQELQEQMDEQLQEVSFNFGDILKGIVSGGEKITIEDLGQVVRDCVERELQSNKSLFLQCFSIAIVATFFSNFAAVFQNKQVGEVGYYIGYLMLVGLVLTAFYQMFSIAENVIVGLKSFMGALLPVYFMLVSASDGSVAAQGGYEIALLAVFVVNLVTCKVLLPGVELYFFVSILDHISREEKFSRFLELLEYLLNSGVKLMLGGVTGMNVIRGLLLPSVQKIKENTILKTSEAIPVVGDVISGTAETVLGVFALLRNAVGITGVVALLLIGLTPMIKLLVYGIVFRLEAAMIQPMGENRIGDCFVGVGKTAILLLRIEGMVFLCFSLTILLLSQALGR